MIAETCRDIFTPTQGAKTPPQMSDDTPPPAQCDCFSFLMCFNVNLSFEHVYTPSNICPYPPLYFKFLEITLVTCNNFQDVVDIRFKTWVS